MTASRADSHDTAAAPKPRRLRFETLDQMLDEVRRIAQADAGGCLQRAGNWSPGQTFGHLAAWINYAYDGYPFAAPWYMRLLGRLIKRRMIHSPMPRGVRIPGTDGGTYAIDDLPLEIGLDRLSRAVERLRTTPPTADNPLLGPLTHEQRIALHLRHAENHLGYFIPDDETTAD